MKQKVTSYIISLKYRNAEDIYYNTEIEERTDLEGVRSCIRYYESFYDEVIYTVTGRVEFIIAIESENKLIEDGYLIEVECRACIPEEDHTCEEQK